jgi:O-antigen ligase
MTAGALLLAFTRSAWMGAAVGIAAMGAVHFMTLSKKQKSNKSVRSTGLAAQKHKLVVPIMLALVTTGFFGAMLMSNQNLAQRMGSVAQPTQAGTLQERQQVWWAGAVAMIKARPLTGWGPGQYAVQQQNFTGKGASTAALTNLQSRGSLANNAHNFYLQTAAELGLPGLVLVVGIIGAFFVTAGKRVVSMDAGIRRSLLIGSIAAIAAFSVDAMSSPAWQFGQVSMFLWLILGAGVSCMRPRVKQEEEAPVVTMAPRLFRPVVAVACALMFSLLVLPTATLTAHADDDYDDNNDLLIFAGILLAAGFLFNAYSDDDEEDTPPPPPATAVIVR